MVNALFPSATSNYNEDENGFILAMQLSTISILPLVVKTAIELDLFEIMAKANKLISASELASLLPIKNNPNAPMIIDRMLRLLASYSVLTCTNETVSINGHDQSQTVYGLGRVANLFKRNEDGVYAADLLLGYQSLTFIEIWQHLKDVVLEGISAVEKSYGIEFFDSEKVIPNFNQIMHNLTILVTKQLLEKYKGFEGLNQLVDVGGCLGTNLSLIKSKYPQIHGINFDLPRVIKEAPQYPGIEHVGGDMFQSVPKGEAIFMKWILHDWGDDECLKILKNCYEALPKTGKVIVVDYVVPELPDNDIVTKNAFSFQMIVFITSGGRERTLKEFETLARKAGFQTIKFVCFACGYGVIEFYKNN